MVNFCAGLAAFVKKVVATIAQKTIPKLLRASSFGSRLPSVKEADEHGSEDEIQSMKKEELLNNSNDCSSSESFKLWDSHSHLMSNTTKKTKNLHAKQNNAPIITTNNQTLPTKFRQLSVPLTHSTSMLYQNFKIGKFLGAGGFGKVMQATSIIDQSTYAIKIIPFSLNFASKQPFKHGVEV
ncbi:hypothetical protein RFI_27008 [Reticulomyxa filosa]|uniref:Protein kinase domain-containing protein n=1 Tax=Reticulomyxa filosa TaxID=46433 RepID=X6M930_RETFI|nr:hypothetical protein RFI_27008 [Reticulomyxa filosa]|eukprot:ETO10369.1 hypothetical protein RFI_27008 [Reticulomyxa filosa]